MVVGETAGTVAVGIASGVTIGAFTVSRLESLLFGIGPFDPATFAGAVVGIAAVAWIAAYLPARRAARADPAQAFRAT